MFIVVIWIEYQEWMVQLVGHVVYNPKNHALDYKKWIFMYNNGIWGMFLLNLFRLFMTYIATLDGNQNVSELMGWLFIAISLTCCLCGEMICASERTIACICSLHNFILTDTLEPNVCWKLATCSHANHPYICWHAQHVHTWAHIKNHRCMGVLPQTSFDNHV